MRTWTDSNYSRTHLRQRHTAGPAPVAIACALLLGTSLTACVDPTADSRELDARDQAIIGGQPESGQPAVVALVGPDGAFCSGTLVRPTVVVTAAHCLEGTSASGLSVYFGADATRLGSGELIPASGVQAHPRYDSYEIANDIGVVTLSRAASATPVDVQTSPMSGDWVGRQALFVGFGTTNAQGDGGGLKFAVQIPVTEVAATTFTYAGRGVNTCYGDSGGPAFATDGSGQLRLIGVTSWGDEGCTQFGVDTRVDAFVDFLQPYLEGQAAPASPGGGGSSGGGSDFCADEGWYGDGWCDEDCPNPDPDCGGDTSGGGDLGGGGAGGDGSDFCADEGWYGDGWCDEDCPNPDPDCGGDTSGGGETGGGAGGGGTDGGGDGGGDLPTDWPASGCSVGGGESASTGLLFLAALAPVAARRRRRT